MPTTVSYYLQQIGLLSASELKLGTIHSTVIETKLKATIQVDSIQCKNFGNSEELSRHSELCSYHALEGSSGLQLTQVSGKPSRSLPAHHHHHYDRRYDHLYHHFALFICLPAREIVQMPRWHLPACWRSLSRDPFLVRPAPERALPCDFWDFCCRCCCRCYFRQLHSALFHLNFRHAAFFIYWPKKQINKFCFNQKDEKKTTHNHNNRMCQRIQRSARRPYGQKTKRSTLPSVRFVDFSKLLEVSSTRFSFASIQFNCCATLYERSAALRCVCLLVVRATGHLNGPPSRRRRGKSVQECIMAARSCYIYSVNCMHMSETCMRCF